MTQEQKLLVRRASLALPLLLLSLFAIYLSILAGRLESGNEAFDRHDYTLAGERYGQALAPFRSFSLLRTLWPGQYRAVVFSNAQLLYAEGKYVEAMDALEQGVALFRSLDGTALYHQWMGNTQFRNAVIQTGKDNEIGIEALQSVADDYEKAMELDRSDWDARYNYEFVKQLLAKKASKDPKDKEALHLMLGEIRLTTEQRSQRKPDKLQ